MNKISNNELSTLAYKKVKSMIISGELKPGQRIVQDNLAEVLGISRTPLRTALQILESETLIESIPRKGVIVKTFSYKEIAEIYDCRIALESTAIKLFTEKSTPKELKELKSIFQPFVNKKKINIKKYQEADSKFHEFIIEKCENSFLAKLFKQSNLLSFMDIIGLVRTPEETLIEHLEIIDAVVNKNIAQAEKLAKDHLEKSKQLILKKTNE